MKIYVSSSLEDILKSMVIVLRYMASFTGHLICSFSIFEAIKKKLHKIDFLLIFCIFRRLEIAILNSKVVMCVKTDNL